MRARMLAVVAAAVACGGAALVSGAPAGAGAAVQSVASTRACAAAAPKQAACFAKVGPERAAPPNTLGSIPYSPATIKAAYGISTNPALGAGTTIAIVDAYDNDRVQADLQTFDNHYGLPPCTKANGCFRKVNQNGGTLSFPPVNKGWAQEIALDVEWAHAIAPGARILLVEAKDAWMDNLMVAERYAVAHADYVSNSWGSGETTGENIYDASFVRTGVSVFASAGDDGWPAEYPSSSSNVISVGGTSLLTNGSGQTVAETGWQYGGGGCSQIENATTAQKTFAQYAAVACNGKRATPDVSLVADPNTGVAVFDNTHWYQFGGTSVSSPIMAARAAGRGGVYDANLVYHGALSFRDITSGNNGRPCVAGYDLCTGRGAPLG